MRDSIKIIVDGFSINQLVKELTIINGEIHAFSDLKPPEAESKGFTITPGEATIIVAGVNGLFLLVNSLLVYLATRKSGIVRIISASGEKLLEFPKDTSPENIQHYKEVLDKMDLQHQHIVVSAEVAPKAIITGLLQRHQ